MMAPIRSALLVVLSLASLVWLPSVARAQADGTDAPLTDFVSHVTRLWADADVGTLVDLIPEPEGLVLDTGSGTEMANSRHAAAALRALFAEHETLDARTVRVTVASSAPPRGFGELNWTFRARGSPGEQTRSVYFAALRRDGSWWITELRLMP